MSKIKSRFEEGEERVKVELPVYSDLELRELNKLLDEKYNGCKKSEDLTQWLKDEGGLNKYGAVIVTGYTQKWNHKASEWYPVCDYPSKYLVLQDKYEKALKLQAKREWAVKSNFKELEKLADSMQINNETLTEEVN